MQTTFDVRIYKTDKYVGTSKTTYRVRWKVGGEEKRQGFRTAAMADSFRSELVTAVRQGQAFDVESGLPAAAVNKETDATSWYDFACRYVDAKWSATSGKHRKSIAEALVTVTVAMLTESAGREAKAVRSALFNWAFNTRQRGNAGQPGEVTETLAWVARRSRSCTDIARPEVLRAVLEAAGSRLDGRAAAGTTARRKRAVLSNALVYAVEVGLLNTNPIGSVTVRAARTTRGIDRRSVVNPIQARILLEEVTRPPRSGPRLVAFFACLYYAGLRPEEAVALRRADLALGPVGEFGWLHLENAAPDTGKHWSDSGRQRDQRGLKHRAVGETRRVPCAPELAQLLREHLERWGTDDEGRLFTGEHGGELATITYVRLWDRARVAALTPEQAVSPLARRPYDLRHAAVSTWLTSGVPAAQVAAWAGHSVAVLHDVYAKCLDGHEEVSLRRLKEAYDG